MVDKKKMKVDASRPRCGLSRPGYPSLCCGLCCLAEDGEADTANVHSGLTATEGESCQQSELSFRFTSSKIKGTCTHK